MAADPPGTDPADQDPHERDLARRSRTPALSPWLVVASIVLLALAAYALFALTG
ncbi:hypothetical protein [Brevundimonas balnearis]|uniref:Uncharacterized protein n=1 Tax=Brevundimonas balnearis TaxID=1572858 RepID=A0ABV6QYW6_9CAUL